MNQKMRDGFLVLGPWQRRICNRQRLQVHEGSRSLLLLAVNGDLRKRSVLSVSSWPVSPPAAATIQTRMISCFAILAFTINSLFPIQMRNYFHCMLTGLNYYICMYLIDLTIEIFLFYTRRHNLIKSVPIDREGYFQDVTFDQCL